MRYLVAAAILLPLSVSPVLASPADDCRSLAETTANVAASVDGMAASLRRRSTKEIIAASRGEQRAALIYFEERRVRLLPELDAYSAAATRLSEAFRACAAQ